MFWMCCSIKAANVQGNLQQIQIISADYMQTNMVRYMCAQVVLYTTLYTILYIITCIITLYYMYM